MTIAQKLTGIFFIWVIISAVFIAGIELNNFVYIRWLALLMLYLVADFLRPKTLILYSIVAGGFVQAIVAIGQQLGYIESGHSQFAITGLLSNPGPLGGFQSVALIISIALAKECVNKHGKLILSFSSLIIAYTVIISDSRASWVASIFGMIALIYEPITNYIRNHRKWILVLLPITVVILSILVYNYRSESARSRLLIWRVSTDMIGDHPVLGHGLASFNKHYMCYQAEFFKKNPRSEFANVADNAAYPYNEFLRIWIELGLVGLLIFVAAFSMTLYSAEARIRAPLITLLIFSQFSYPSSVDALLIMLPLLLGLSSPRKRCKYTNVAAISFFLVALSFLLFENQFKKGANKKLQKVLFSADEQTELYIERNKCNIAAFPQLNTLYLFTLMKQPGEIDRGKLNVILPNCENWCDIGDMYVHQGMFDIAEKYFMEASFMIPTRFKPKYLLFKMYQKTNRLNDAVRISKIIQGMPLKIENTYTLKHKAEIRDFLNRINQ